MESSPLTQQNRPDVWEPKVGQLYLHLFNGLANEGVEDVVPSEGFWRELFLLNPDKSLLYQILEPLTANDTLHIQTQTKSFFRRAVFEVASGVTPSNENALENLTAFLSAVLAKRYTNPSADMIEVLGGLDTIDKLISDLVLGLETIIRQGSRIEVRTKAIETALALVSGAYQTTLVSYFIHRDLFPALMKYVHDSESDNAEAFILVGLLANYNKFEMQNLYQNRLQDFVNEPTIQRLARNVGSVSRKIRERYVQVQDDTPEGWTLSSTLNMVGLRSLSPEPRNRKAPPTEEEVKTLFNALPSLSATVSLSTYSFVNANKLFATTLATLPPEPGDRESSFSSFLSCSSYMCHNAHRSTRATTYAMLNLLTLRLMCEDSIILKRLSAPDQNVNVRLARQRPPFLPHVSTPRSAVTAMLDICTDCLSHNLRRRLSIPFYSLTLAILMRIITHLESSKLRLQHHWSYIWGCLLSLLRFLVTYSSDLASVYSVRDDVATPLTSLIAFCLSRGDAFLPDPASYDDLFYKLVEAGDTLKKFKEIYCPAAKGADTNTSDPLTRSMNALLSISNHYHSILSQSGKKIHQSPAAVQKVIKDGYESLDLDFGTGSAAAGGTGVAGDFGQWDKFREGEWKGELKRIIRVVVEDARRMGVQQDRPA